MKSKRRLLRGFTLIELLVVIAIIGLLATMSVVSFSTSREKARISKGMGFSGQILRSTGDDLVSRWDFDECSGTSLVDSSGYSHNGTLVSGVTFSANTPTGQGCSLSFDGTQASGIAITVPSLSTKETRAMWFYLNSAASQPVLLDDGPVNNLIQIFNGHIRTSVFDSNASIVTGKWYFIATAYDGVSFTLYIDGSADKSLNTVAVPAPTSLITLGSSGLSSAKLTGLLNDIRIYNRSLTSQEIHQMYAEGLPRHVALKR